MDTALVILPLLYAIEKSQDAGYQRLDGLAGKRKKEWLICWQAPRVEDHLKSMMSDFSMSDLF